MRRIALFTCTLFLVLTACAAQADEVVVTLGGDCVLGTREEWKDDAETFDTLIAEKGFDWCFSKISEPFLNDDISLVNLETVLQSHSEGHARGKEFTFRGDPSYTGILKAAGIEQVNIANNHYIDFGGSGRESTRAALEAAGIGFSGYTYRSVVEVNGYRIGFAGCRAGAPPPAHSADGCPPRYPRRAGWHSPPFAAASGYGWGCTPRPSERNR